MTCPNSKASSSSCGVSHYWFEDNSPSRLFHLTLYGNTSWSAAGVCGFMRQQLALATWRWGIVPLPSTCESLVAIPNKVVFPPGNVHETLAVQIVALLLSVGGSVCMCRLMQCKILVQIMLQHHLPTVQCCPVGSSSGLLASAVLHVRPHHGHRRLAKSVWGHGCR